MDTIEKIHLVHKLDHTKVDQVELVSSSLIALGRSCSIQAVTADEIDSSTLVIAIGGDGTMLEAIRRAARNEAYVLGINLGKLGFLNEFDPNYLLPVVDFFNRIPDTIENRNVLVVKDVSGKETIAVNEVVVSKLYSDEILKYDLQISGKSAGSHVANSVIICSPTGSTGYALSVNGSLIDPAADVFQIVPVAPITLTSRPIIVGANNEISVGIQNSADDCVLKVDGRTVGFDIDSRIKVSKYKNQVKIVHTPEWNFFDVLTKKLGWNAK